ncbi:helix-turn-helix transcriptional regulator [Actinoplanes sp. NPDC024001]|uniref:helix-turn-helix domain-containing protein n=1 Tax=Actinoplanes sp. NPDC024001 TaxID=3154598 RepID=UPI0033FD9919
MITSRDPMVQRRRLRVELRKAREAAGLSQREVAPAMDWSLSKLIRIETGAVGISINDLKVLLQLYKIDDQVRIDELIGMARAAKEPAWWAPYKDVITQELSRFLSYESAASIIRNFEPVVVPGLLQTEEYARATLAQMAPSISNPNPKLLDQIDSLVDLRMDRQERLSQREDAPKIFLAMDESVLRRQVGTPDVMRRQLERIRHALTQPDATIWIVPFGAGLYQMMRGAYVLFELPSPGENEDVLYLEDFRGELLIKDDMPATAAYLESFWNIEQIALKNEDAIAMVERAIADI